MKNVRSLWLRRTLIATSGAVVFALMTLSLEGVAQDRPPSKAEQAIKYRQSVYKVILWNFGPLAAMVQDKIPYDATDFARRAERVSLMAPMLLEGYPPGSDTGAKTRAKPDIWTHMEDFTTLMHDMEAKAATLASVAKEGDLAKSRAAFGELGDACKACHDKYRSE